jgi:adenosylhomocysteine nucleosidase
MNNSTGIVIATKIEAEPFIKGLGLETIDKKPVHVMGNGAVVLAISDIGKSNAAIATAHLIERHHLSRICNIGAAGAVDRNFEIGDIYHIDKIYELDRPRLLSDDPVVHKPDTLKGFRMASLATQDRPMLKDLDRMAAGKLADLVDMEGAAVVQACQAFGVSAYLFKIVTDCAGCTPREILVNMLKTRDSLFEFFRERVMPAM